MIFISTFDNLNFYLLYKNSSEGWIHLLLDTSTSIPAILLYFRMVQGSIPSTLWMDTLCAELYCIQNKFRATILEEEALAQWYGSLFSAHTASCPTMKQAEPCFIHYFRNSSEKLITFFFIKAMIKLINVDLFYI